VACAPCPEEEGGREQEVQSRRASGRRRKRRMKALYKIQEVIFVAGWKFVLYLRHRRIS
jgi:hypothetical protein